MNSFLKKLVSLVFCVGVLSLCSADDEVMIESPVVGYESVPTDAPVSLTVSSAVREELANFKAERPAFDSDNSAFVDTVDKELKNLRHRYGDTVVDLESEEVRRLAPQISTFVVGGVDTVAKLARITKPGVKLTLVPGSVQYNAAAQGITETLTKTTRTYLVDERGNRTLVGEKVDVEQNKISDIVVGAQLVRLFVWRKDRVALFAAILGHEVGHIVFDHKTEAVSNEHEADLFAVKMLKKGTDLNTALDMLSLAANTSSTLERFVKDEAVRNDFVRAAVNRVVMDVADLSELGKAESHSYVATVIFNALQREKKRISNEISRSNLDEACFAIYEALKRACESPSGIFGVPSKQIQMLCAKMERDSRHMNTHPVPSERRALIEAISRR
jgi:hypothetical protein